MHKWVTEHCAKRDFVDENQLVNVPSSNAHLPNQTPIVIPKQSSPTHCLAFRGVVDRWCPCTNGPVVEKHGLEIDHWPPHRIRVCCVDGRSSKLATHLHQYVPRYQHINDVLYSKGCYVIRIRSKMSLSVKSITQIGEGQYRFRTFDELNIENKI